MKLKIFSKTFVCTAAIMAGLVIFSNLVIYMMFPQVYLENTKKDLSNKANMIADDLSGQDLSSIENYLKIYAKSNNIEAAIKKNQDKAELSFNNVGKIDKDSLNNLIFIEERKIKIENGQEIMVQFFSSRNAEKDAKNLILRFLPYSIFLGLLFTIIFSYIASKIIVKPLIKVAEIASDVEKAKTDFLRSTSHEIKTPLTSLRIMLENMRYKIGKYRDREKYLDESINTVDAIAEMVSRILTFSDHEVWLKDVKRINVAKKIEKIVDEYRVMIQEKNLDAKIELGDEKINMSERAFQQLFSNLISNAVKYCNDGGIIRIYRENNWLKIENTGENMAKVEIDTAFELFSHGGKGGNGVGLFVVKNILEQYGLRYKIGNKKNGVVFAIKIK